MDFLIKLGQIAGIAGIALGIIFLLFKQIIAKKIFPSLKQDHAYKVLRLIIVLLFVIGMVGMILWTINPFIEKYANNTKAKNPFGDEEILLNDNALFFTKSNLDETSSKNIVKEKKYLFQIDSPNSEEYAYELITAPQYAERFNQGASQEIDGLRLLKDAHVFRIFRKKPIILETTNKTFTGEKVSENEFNEAWKYWSDMKDNDTNNVSIGSIEKSIAFEDTTELFKDMDEEEKEEAREDIEYLNKTRSYRKLISDTNTLYNELAIVIFDKENYEKTLIASNKGRKIEPNPLNFLFAAGGTMPYLDILSIKQASVSKDNKVWGFYGQRKFNKIKIDGKDEDELYMDFYRIYTMNSSYIYQITLTYVSSPKTPRSTWDDLVSSLQSLRIVQ